MPAAVYNFKIEKGTSWHLDIVLKNEEGNYIALGGYTGLCKIKQGATSEEVIATPTVTITDPIAGKIRLSLTSEETLEIPTSGRTFKDLSTYYYDLYIVDSNGITTRLLNGTVSVSPEVSF